MLDLAEPDGVCVRWMWQKSKIMKNNYDPVFDHTFYFDAENGMPQNGRTPFFFFFITLINRQPCFRLQKLTLFLTAPFGLADYSPSSSSLLLSNLELSDTQVYQP